MIIRKDRLLAVTVALGAIVCFIPTLEFTKEAAYYPRTILILIFLLCIPLWLKAKSDQIVDLKAVFKQFFTSRNLLYVVVAIILLIAFMEIIGLYLELPVFTAFIMYRLGYRKKGMIVGISLGLTLIIYMLFSLMLKVHIPMGFLSIL